MKRLLFVLCSLVAVQEVCARRPAVRFDLPYTVEHGKYVVVLGTPAGPRRFIFDTGASGTCISESLRCELGAETVKTQKVRDFEGHVVPIDLVRLDSLRMGDALFRDHPVLVMPDTSQVFACLRVDGIAGCDLLRWCAVRMPNADSTITVTDDVRRLGLPRGRRMSRMELGGGCPFLPVTCRNGDRQARMYVKFDTGSAGYFHFSYADSGDAPPPLWFIDSLRWADGYASAIGWTNRNRVNSYFRGTIPRFEIQGTAIADMPVKRTFGHNRILGCKLLDWGQVVLDFRRKRFLFVFPLAYQLNLIARFDACTEHTQHALGICSILAVSECDVRFELHRLLAQDSRRSKMQSRWILDCDFLTYHALFPPMNNFPNKSSDSTT